MSINVETTPQSGQTYSGEVDTSMSRRDFLKGVLAIPVVELFRRGDSLAEEQMAVEQAGIQAAGEGQHLHDVVLPDIWNSAGFTYDIQAGRLIPGGAVREVLERPASTFEETHAKAASLYRLFDSTLPEGAEGKTNRNKLLWSFVGTAASMGALADLTVRGRPGARDYMALVGISAASMIDPEGFSVEELEENVYESAAAVGTMELYVLGAKVFRFRESMPLKSDNQAEELIRLDLEKTKKMDILRKLVYLSNTLGSVASTFVTSGALRPVIHELARREVGTLHPDDDELQFEIQETVNDHNGSINLDDPDISQFIQELVEMNGRLVNPHDPDVREAVEQFIENHGGDRTINRERVDRLMEVFSLRKTDELDPDLISATQQYIGNSLGEWALLATGGGLSPRQAILTKKGPAFLQAINTESVPLQITSNAAFVSEIVRRLPTTERQGSLIADTLRVLNPAGYAHALKEFSQEATTNPLAKIQQILMKHLEFNGKTFILNAKTQLGEIAPEFTHQFQEITQALRTKNLKEIYRAFSNTDAAILHTVGNVLGEDVADVASLIALQALGIPFERVTMSWAFEQAETYLPKNIPFREYVLDGLAYKFFQNFSKVADNYVAEVIGMSVMDDRLRRHQESQDETEDRGVHRHGELDQEALDKLRMYYHLFTYDACMHGGGGLPTGGVPPLQQASLREYPLKDAFQFARFLKRDTFPADLTFAEIIGKYATGIMTPLKDSSVTSQQSHA